jgi:hypothetical protein
VGVFRAIFVATLLRLGMYLTLSALRSRPSELRQLALQVDTLLYGESPPTVTLAGNRAVERLVTHMSHHYSEHIRLQDSRP